MPKITKIEAQQKTPGRYSVFIDDEFTFGIDEENLIKFELHKGKELTQQEVDHLFQETELFKLYSRALDFLSYRPRSEKEVRDYLREKGVKYKVLSIKGEESIGAVTELILKRLKQRKYLDDTKFTRWWVKQRTESSSPRGPHYIRSELYQKGINRKLVDEVWQESGIDEYKLCQKAVKKRTPRYDLSDPKDRKKLSDHLSRRGFNFEVIKNILDEVSNL